MSQKKSYFIQYLLPALVTLIVVFAGIYYFGTRPAYQAMLVVNGQPFWRITGNDSNMEVVSLTPFSNEKDVILMLKSQGDKPYLVGVIPRQGNGDKKRFSLPLELEVGVGDKIEVIETTDNNDIVSAKTLFISRLVPVGH